jgi:hypothetical protein
MNKTDVDFDPESPDCPVHNITRFCRSGTVSIIEIDCAGADTLRFDVMPPHPCGRPGAWHPVLRVNGESVVLTDADLNGATVIAHQVRRESIEVVLLLQQDDSGSTQPAAEAAETRTWIRRALLSLRCIRDAEPLPAEIHGGDARTEARFLVGTGLALVGDPLNALDGPDVFAHPELLHGPSAGEGAHARPQDQGSAMHALTDADLQQLRNDGMDLESPGAPA